MEPIYIVRIFDYNVFIVNYKKVTIDIKLFMRCYDEKTSNCR